MIDQSRELKADVDDVDDGKNGKGEVRQEVGLGRGQGRGRG